MTVKDDNADWKRTKCVLGSILLSNVVNYTTFQNMIRFAWMFFTISPLEHDFMIALKLNKNIKPYKEQEIL